MIDTWYSNYEMKYENDECKKNVVLSYREDVIESVFFTTGMSAQHVLNTTLSVFILAKIHRYETDRTVFQDSQQIRKRFDEDSESYWLRMTISHEWSSKDERRQGPYVTRYDQSTGDRTIRAYWYVRKESRKALEKDIDRYDAQKGKIHPSTVGCRECLKSRQWNCRYLLITPLL